MISGIIYHMDKALFAGLKPAPISRYHYTPTDANTLARNFLYETTAELQKVYMDWGNYLGTELDILKVAMEQNTYRKRILEIIRKIDDRMQNYRMISIDDALREKMLNLMSNCCQIIRDLSVEIKAEDATVVQAAAIPTEAQDTLEKWMMRYESYDIVKKIRERSALSEKIIGMKRRIANGELEEKSDSLIETLRNDCPSAYDWSIQMYQNQIETAKQTIKEYENRLAIMEEASGRDNPLFFSRKKRMKAEAAVMQEEMERLATSVRMAEAKIRTISKAKDAYRVSMENFLKTEERKLAMERLADKKHSEKEELQLKLLNDELTGTIRQYNELADTWPATVA